MNAKTKIEELEHLAAIDAAGQRYTDTIIAQMKAAGDAPERIYLPQASTAAETTALAIAIANLQKQLPGVPVIIATA
jgi:hypothetical protein